MNVNSKQEETAVLVFPREGEGKGKSGLQVALSAGLPSKVHVLSPLENITHEQSTQLRGKRLFKCNVHQTNSHLFFGWTASSRFGGFGFFCIWFGILGGLFCFLKVYFTLPAFKSRIAGWERQVCRSGCPQGVWGFKSQEKKPSPQRKTWNKNNAFLRRSTAFKEIPPAFPLCSDLPLERAGVEVTVQEYGLDSIKGIT